MPHYKILELIECPIRRLTRIERDLIHVKGGDSYKWVTTAQAKLVFIDNHSDSDQEIDHSNKTNIVITIPAGFLTDGDSGGPDFGNAWLFHDWIYSTHKSGDHNKWILDATIQDANQLMYDILVFERAPIFSKLFSFVSKCNPCCLFTTAWRNSGRRGPQFLNQFY